MREEFRNKAAKYQGGKTFAKKQTRFDKMKLKEELGFELKMNPVITKMKRADEIMKRVLLSDALLRIRRF